MSVKRSRNKIAKIIFSLLGITVLAIVLIGCSIGWRITKFNTSTPPGNYSCAIVLGAAVTDEQPSPVYKARLDHGLELYQQKRVTKIISTGGVGDDDILSEGEVGARYLISKGIPEGDVLFEKVSLTTLGNLEQAKPLMEEHKLDSALIVSDPIHLRRAMIIAESIGINAFASGTPYSQFKTSKTKTPFLLNEIYFSSRYLFKL